MIDDAQKQLMDLFGFDRDDLRANKSGQLSPKQAAKFSDADRSGNKTLIVIALVGWVVTLAIIYSLYKNPPPAIQDGVGRYIMLGIFGAGSVWVTKGIFTKVDYSVGKVSGPGKVVKAQRTSSYTDSISERRTTEHYELLVGGRGFFVSPEGATIIKDNARYTVYFVNGTEQLLSVEVVDTNEN